MTFATPILALIAAGIAVPPLIILYFLKLRRRDVEVSTTLLWKKAIQDLQANAPFQKLRNNILLILQLIALAAILLALAQPEFKNTGSINQRQIILIDRSASMSADDGDAGGGASPTTASSHLTRLDAAKKKALAVVDALHEPGLVSLESLSGSSAGEEAMVIAFDTSAEVRQAFTSNRAELRAAINAITPTDAPSSLQRAFDLAKAYTGTKKFEDQVKEKTAEGKPAGFIPASPPVTLHLFSDGRLPDADKIETGLTDTVVYHAVGSPKAVNVGITGLRAERAFDNPSRVNIFVGLQSTDPSPRKVDVEISVDGQVATARDVNIAPATTPVGVQARQEATNDKGAPKTAELRPGLGGFVYPLDRPQGGVATVRLTTTGPDVLPSDNLAYLVIPPAKRMSVLLVMPDGGTNYYLERVLKGLRLSRLDIKTPAELQTLVDQNQLDAYDVIVLDRTLPMVPGQKPGSKAAGLPPGRTLVLGAVPSPPLGANDLGPGDAGVFLDYARDHPALRLAELDKVAIAKTRKVSVLPNTPVRVLARDTFGPAILEITDTNVLALVVPFDVTESDWMFNPGFVLFIANSIAYLSETQAGSAADGVHAGETLDTRLPRSAKSVRLALPDGSVVHLDPAPDGTVSFGPISRSGVYRLNWLGDAGAGDTLVDGDRGHPQRAIAANLLDPAESDLGTRPTISLASQVVQAKGKNDAILTRKLWPWLLLAALGVVMLEWFIYNRKVAI